MAVVTILKITKIMLSQQRIEQSSRNLARLCKMGLLTAQTVKSLNFQNPRRQRPSFWKPLNCHISATVWLILMKSGTIMHISPTREKTFKISNFWKSKMVMAISQQQIERSLQKIWHDYTKWVSYCQDHKNLNFQNPRWRRPPFWKPLNRHISTTIWPILMKFGTLMHIRSIQGRESLKFWIFENPRWLWPPSWKSQKSQYLSNELTDLHEIWHDGAECAS